MSNPGTPVLHLVVGVNGHPDVCRFTRVPLVDRPTERTQNFISNYERTLRKPPVEIRPQLAVVERGLPGSECTESFQRRRRASWGKWFFVHRSKIDRFRETREHRFRVFLHYLDMRTSELAIRCAERRIFQVELGSPCPPFMQSSLRSFRVDSICAEPSDQGRVVRSDLQPGR